MNHRFDHIEYIHRPVTKLSIGGFSTGDSIIVSACFANRRDQFSRKISRDIINERICNFLNNSTTNRFVKEIKLNGQSPRQFMQKLRERVKPSQEENDTVFNVAIPYTIQGFEDLFDYEVNLPLYGLMSVDQKWEVIANACVSI